MIFWGILSVNLLSGCAWFNDEESMITTSVVPKVDNQFQTTTIWHRSVGVGSGDFYSNLHPAYQNTHVFVADRRGVVKALDVDTGKEIWSTNLSVCGNSFLCNRPAQLSGGITVASDRLYVSSELAKVYALSAQDGSLVWETIVAGEALSSPVVSDGVVLVHTSNGMLQALNEANGTVKWTVNLDVSGLSLRGESAPTTAFGIAIVGGDDGRVSAVIINHGQLVWRQHISQSSGDTEIARINNVKTTPVIINNVVYALAYNGNLAAMNLRSGQIMWSREIGSVTNLLVDRGKIYLVDKDDRIIAVDTNGGIILWCQSELLHRNLTSPVLYNGYIVTGDSEGYLHWINTDKGRLVRQKKVDKSGLLATPIVAGNKLIVQTKNGEVYAITC